MSRLKRVSRLNDKYGNSFAARAKQMTYPNAYDNVNYGERTKIVARKVVLKSTDGSGETWGSKTILTKEDTDYLLEDADELTSVPEVLIRQIKTLIRKGAEDTSQQWENALELTNKAYQVANVPLPDPSKKGAWDQYETMISFAVKQLAATRGVSGKWRVSTVLYTESSSTKRFFVEMPNEDAVEVVADSLDDIIRDLVNTCRAKGVIISVDTKTQHGAVLHAHVKDDESRETIVIKVL
jgi:hypothetical protein